MLSVLLVLARGVLVGIGVELVSSAGADPTLADLTGADLRGVGTCSSAVGAACPGLSMGTNGSSGLGRDRLPLPLFLLPLGSLLADSAGSRGAAVVVTGGR